MTNFKDKVVIITGGGEGIGRALALEFFEKGATIIINDINEHNLEETQKLLKSDIKRCFCYKADISKNDEVNAFAAFVKNHFGKIDLLVNNAGVSIGRINAVDIPQNINNLSSILK